MLISEERRFRNSGQNPLSSGLQLKRLKEDKFQNLDLLNGENKHNHGNTEKRVDGGRQYCDGWVDDAAKGGFREEEEEEEEEGEKKEEEQEALARPAPRQAEMVTGDTEHQK